MSKVVANICLHYGVPYLSDSIRSVRDAVDEIVIVYTHQPSHGFSTSLVCPDSREELIDVAYSAAGDKLRWFESGRFSNESAHRSVVFETTPDAHIVLVVDSDEIWRPDELERLLKTAADGKNRNYLAFEMPFWRSFTRAIPDKLCQPVRAINTHYSDGTQSSDTYFAHFGYCQPTKYIEYKMTCQGHRNDWRPEWFEEKWLPNAQLDLHPTNVNFWNARAVNPLDYLPDWMKMHKYANCEVIE